MSQTLNGGQCLVSLNRRGTRRARAAAHPTIYLLPQLMIDS
jgi:hypothetical protein